MSEHPTVALSKLIYWYDAPRIQTWPSLLAQIQPDELIRSVTECGRKISSARMTDPDHLADYDYVRNFPGLETIAGRLVLRGVGFLDACPGGYRLSESALELAEAFREDPTGKAWVRLLARTLVTREPRTRVLVHCLSYSGARLIFSKPAWFSGALQPARIETAHGETIYPFDETDKLTPNLRTILTDRSWWALGAWRESPLLDGALSCILTGQRKPAFSLHRIGQALRAPCEVLHHLGILHHDEGEGRLDTAKAFAELGEDLAQDFGWQSKENEPRSPAQLINDLLPELRSPTGYVVASELRKLLQEHGMENPDRDIAELESSGVILIEAESHGQGRHGRGLYGDPHKQLLKLRVLT